MIYVPRLVFDELETIMVEEGLNRRAEAFDKLTSFSKVGRQVVKKARLDKVSLSDVLGRKKVKKDRGVFFE